MTLGRKIEFLRKERGLTQIQLAELLGMTAHHLSRWENDRIRPRGKTLGKLAENLGVSLTELLSGQTDTHVELAKQDPELAEMIPQLVNLDPDQRYVLKHMVRSMLTCRQMEQVVTKSRELKTARSSV